LVAPLINAEETGLYFEEKWVKPGDKIVSIIPALRFLDELYYNLSVSFLGYDDQKLAVFIINVEKISCYGIIEHYTDFLYPSLSPDPNTSIVIADTYNYDSATIKIIVKRKKGRSLKLRIVYLE